MAENMKAVMQLALYDRIVVYRDITDPEQYGYRSQRYTGKSESGGRKITGTIERFEPSELVDTDVLIYLVDVDIDNGESILTGSYKDLVVRVAKDDTICCLVS